MRSSRLGRGSLASAASAASASPANGAFSVQRLRTRPWARLGCDVLVTGEASFHRLLEAEANGIAMILPGHYATERFAVEALAETIARELPNIDVWPSQTEREPTWVM